MYRASCPKRITISGELHSTEARVGFAASSRPLGWNAR